MAVGARCWVRGRKSSPKDDLGLTRGVGKEIFCLGQATRTQGIFDHGLSLQGENFRGGLYKSLGSVDIRSCTFAERIAFIDASFFQVCAVLCP